ncbi:hypothetical protein LY78DRAFT_651158 [Colletotrichum sublineola]|nr:hypothetical protein LY78DRAFT_651158 [Colletotrichum sublineola]
MARLLPSAPASSFSSRPPPSKTSVPNRGADADSSVQPIGARPPGAPEADQIPSACLPVHR